MTLYRVSTALRLAIELANNARLGFRVGCPWMSQLPP
jgi:hypothetical protein